MYATVLVQGGPLLLWNTVLPLLAAVLVPYFISNNILRARTSTGTVSALPNLVIVQYRYNPVVYSSRTVSYRSTGVE